MNYLKGFEMSKKNPRKLRIAVIAQMFIYDDEEDLFEYEDYIYEHIGFVPLSPEHTQFHHGDIGCYELDNNNIDTLEEAVEYVKTTAKCNNVYGIIKHISTQIEYHIVPLNNKNMWKLDGRLEYLAYSPKNKINIKNVSNRIEKFLTIYANNVEVWDITGYEIEPENFVSAFKNEFGGYTPFMEHIFECDPYNTAKLFRITRSNVKRADYVIRVDFDSPIYAGKIYDKHANLYDISDF